MSRFAFALVGAILPIGNHTISEYLRRIFMHRGRWAERPHLPRSARWGYCEHLAAGNHEVIRMAWVLDLGKSCLERRLEHRSGVVGAQLKPGTQTRLLIIGCIVGELDAEMSPAGKADNEHRLVDAQKLNGPYRAPQDRLKALRQLPAPVRAREDVHIAAKSDLPRRRPAAEGRATRPEQSPWLFSAAGPRSFPQRSFALHGFRESAWSSRT